MKTKLIAALVSLALVGCGRSDVAGKLEPVGTVQQSLGPCGVAGEYWGTGTVTKNTGGGVRCSENTPGTVNTVGVEFDANGVLLSYLGAGMFPWTCTSTYNGCSVHVDCPTFVDGHNPSNTMGLTFDLAFDPNGDTATGTYEVTGSGEYCSEFDMALNLTR